MRIEVEDEIVPQDFHREDPEVDEVVFMPGVREIGLNAFRECQNLVRVRIPNTVQRIGPCAFMMCGRLSELIIEDGLQRIERTAFWRCPLLTQVNFPQSLLFVGDQAFARCERLVSIRGLGGNVERGAGAFAESPWLVEETRANNEVAHAGLAGDAGVDGPARIIAILRGRESIAGQMVNYHDEGCVQLGRYFRQVNNDRSSVHFEILAIKGKGEVWVEIHSERGSTPEDVHKFIRQQFSNHNLAPKGTNGSFRFATRSIYCGGDENYVVANIEKAIDEIYQKYGPYLAYLQDYYGRNGLDGCMGFEEWCRLR